MRARLISASVTSVVIILALAAIVTPCHGDPASGIKEASVVKVLHVSPNICYNEVQKVLRIAGAENLFDIEQLRLSEFNDGEPTDLSQYDAIVFGIGDCFDGGGQIKRVSELRSYVEDGGGIVWTHDSLEYGVDLGPDVEEPAGVDYYYTLAPERLYEVEVMLDHQIIHIPFEIGHVGDAFPIQETHTTGGHVTTADVVLKFSQWNGGDRNFYLTAHKWAKGRVVVDEIGHKLSDCNHNFLGWPSVTESRIFVNALCWAAGAICSTRAHLDIDPDTLNLKSKGRWITAYVSAENASVHDMDVSTILLQDALAPERWDYQDDVLMLKFDRQEFKDTVQVGDSVQVKIAGKWEDGTAFEAHDSIRVINPGR